MMSFCMILPCLRTFLNALLSSSFLHLIDLTSKILFPVSILSLSGHVAPLLSCLLQVMYTTSDRLTEQKRERERGKKGAYRAYKNKKSVAPSPSLSVPLSVPLPWGTVTGMGMKGTIPSMATTSKHLYTVCVCVLIIVNNPAVRPLLSTMTVTVANHNHHHHPAWMKHYPVNANSRVSRVRRKDVTLLCYHDSLYSSRSAVQRYHYCMHILELTRTHTDSHFFFSF